jgi:hypothetical protein
LKRQDEEKKAVRGLTAFFVLSLAFFLFLRFYSVDHKEKARDKPYDPSTTYPDRQGAKA